MILVANGIVRTKRGDSPPRRHWRIPFHYWFPLTIFAATRLVNFIMISLAAQRQVMLSDSFAGYYVNTPMPASPSYLSVITNWDGQWYERIATGGYGVPLSSANVVAIGEGHAWFPPLFPLAASAIMRLTGAGFGAAATFVNLAAGAAAMVLIFLLLERTAGRFVASALVAMICSFISAPVLQFAYTESLALFFLSAALLLIQRRRYGFAVLAISALALTRLITPPLAVVIAAHAWSRYQRRSEAPIRWTEVIGMLGAGLMSLGGVSFWSFIATGWLSAPDGTDANRGSVSGLADMTFGWFGALYHALGYLGLALIVMLVLMLVRIAYDARSYNWGAEVRAWYWAYPAFVLAGPSVHAGMVRYMLLAFPLLLTLVGSPQRDTTPRVRVVLVVAVCLIGLVAQWFWIDHALIMHQASVTVWMP